MTNKEKAALLAAGEKRLAFLGRAMEEAIRDKDLSFANTMVPPTCWELWDCSVTRNARPVPVPCLTALW